MNFIKIFFLLFVIISTNVFGKSGEYYEQTAIHILTASNSSNQKQVFEQEIKYLFYQLFERLLEKIRIELLEKKVKEGKFI
jgi:uncharacterized protein YggT (Ycf19 family)